MWTLHRSPKLGSIPRYSKDPQVFGPESKGRDTSLQGRCSRAVYDSSIGEIWKNSSAEFGSYAEAEKYLKVCLDLAEWNGFNMVARVLEVAEILLFWRLHPLSCLFFSQDAEEFWEWDSCSWTLGDLPLGRVSSDASVSLSQKGTGKKREPIT